MSLMEVFLPFFLNSSLCALAMALSVLPGWITYQTPSCVGGGASEVLSGLSDEFSADLSPVFSVPDRFLLLLDVAVGAGEFRIFVISFFSCSNSSRINF